MQVVFLAQAVTPLPLVVVPETDAGVVDASTSDAHSEVVVEDEDALEPCTDSPTHEEIVNQALFTLRLIEETASASRNDGAK